MEVTDERRGGKKFFSGEFFKKFKSAKNLQIVAVVFIIAVALVIYSTVTMAKPKSDEASASTVMTSAEQRLSAILASVDGAGQVDAMITEREGKIVGVLIVADGAKNISVRLRLMDAAANALGVSKDVVSVCGRK